MRVQIIDFGAVITAIEVPDRDGRMASVVLGLPDLKGYETVSPSFGAVIGRYANRIAGGRFTLDGTTYQLPTNDRGNTLHGGPRNFGLRLWRVTGSDATGLTSPGAPRTARRGFPATRRRGPLQPPRRRHAPPRLPRRHRPADGREPHEPQLLQPRGGGGRATSSATTCRWRRIPSHPPMTRRCPRGRSPRWPALPSISARPTRWGSGFARAMPQIVFAKGYDNKLRAAGPRGDLRRAATCQDPGAGAASKSGRPGRRCNSIRATTSTRRLSARPGGPTAPGMRSASRHRAFPTHRTPRPSRRRPCGRGRSSRR